MVERSSVCCVHHLTIACCVIAWHESLMCIAFYSLYSLRHLCDDHAEHLSNMSYRIGSLFQHDYAGASHKRTIVITKTAAKS